MPKKVEVLGIKIDPLVWFEVKQRLEVLLNRKMKSQIVTINSEFIKLAQINPDFKDCLNQSQLRVADGVGVIIAAKFLASKQLTRPLTKHLEALLKLLGLLILSVVKPESMRGPIPERIAGVDLAIEIVKIATAKRLKIFLLGAGIGVAEKAALKLQTDYYGLGIAGTYSGSPNIEEEDKIVRLINKHKADIIFVAYGAPQQELWLKRNLGKTKAKIGIGLGGTLDFLAGERKRAPLWMQRRGLEWLHRLFQDPAKRFKRTLSLTSFFWQVIKYKINTTAS